MKFLLFYFITTAALVSVVVPQAKRGTIYFPDDNPGDDTPNTDNSRIKIENQYWTTHPGSQGNPNAGGQCVLTSFPPDLQSGCCGRQVSDDNRITDVDNRPDGNDVGVSFGTRISGGEETGLTQYPWTVHLLSIYSYQTKRDEDFNCGGSLISAKYVLSAAHCVTKRGGVLKSLVVNLAEYDLRTYPQDCKTTTNGTECVENVRIIAEKVIRHPQYDDVYLSNDIALIRLNGTAPYTQFIRPICLPTIDIESPDFRRPQFAVAGWGLNGEHESNIKQATVLNLVNREVCKRDYTYLTEVYLCAAGNNGEDSCSGDSGGPLMSLYKGSYIVSGIVSGKRRDLKCGSTTPSLYTNVYHYLDWIRNNMEQ